MREGAVERQRRYRLNNPENAKKTVSKYQASEKGRATIAAYNKSIERRVSLAKYNATERARGADQRYRKSIKNLICQRKYDATPQGKLRRALRDRISKVIKRGKGVRAGSAVRDLGCSIEFFKSYIADRFQFGMSWNNYGEWHLDHIRPLCLFDLSVREDFLEACHYTNFQPLWAADNLRKAFKLLEAA